MIQTMETLDHQEMMQTKDKLIPVHRLQDQTMDLITTQEAAQLQTNLFHSLSEVFSIVLLTKSNKDSNKQATGSPKWSPQLMPP